MNNVQVIPTKYHDTLFRSRLEARYAVLFDALRMPWQYEPEAFGNGVIGYLPDFWLPEQGVYIEVKSTDEYDHAKVELACHATEKPVVVVVGRPGLPKHMSFGCVECTGDSTTAPFVHSFNGWDNFFLLAECPYCFRLGFTRSAQALKCDCYAEESDPHSASLHAAYQAARHYRFWNPA